MIDENYCCVHYETDRYQGNYVDVFIDNHEYGLCHKCFRLFQHKKGVRVIRYVNRGAKISPPSDCPF